MKIMKIKKNKLPVKPCPKKLKGFPCGGSAQGICELKDRRCIFWVIWEKKKNDEI